MLGWVAAVMAIVSPSQPRPAAIQRTSSSVTGLLFSVPNAIRCSVDDVISLRFWKRKRPRYPSFGAQPGDQTCMSCPHSQRTRPQHVSFSDLNCNVKRIAPEPVRRGG